MAKTVTNTGGKARLISKPKYIVATLNEGTENEKNYIFDHVLKDSTKFSQDPNMLSLKSASCSKTLRRAAVVPLHHAVDVSRGRK